MRVYKGQITTAAELVKLDIHVWAQERKTKDHEMITKHWTSGRPKNNLEH